MNYNLIMYIGTSLLVGGFLLFLYSQIKLRQEDIENFRQEQLSKSFEKGKL